MATVTKKELIDRIADELNQSRPRAQIKGVQVKRVVQKFLDLIIEELAKALGEAVSDGNGEQDDPSAPRATK